jgi:ATP-dependent DNA helicase PIF1
LHIGGGTNEVNNEGEVLLPEGLCIPYTGNDKDLDALIEWVFPKLDENKADSNYITSRAILSTKNDCVCRKNRFHIIVGCVALCLSAGIYRVQES